MYKNHTRSEPKLSTATPAAWKAVDVPNMGLCRPFSSLASLRMLQNSFHTCRYVRSLRRANNIIQISSHYFKVKWNLSSLHIGKIISSLDIK